MKEDTAGQLKKKIALFQQYLTVGNRIRESLSTENSEDLIGLLSTRQQFIDQMESVDRALEKETGNDIGAFARLWEIGDIENAENMDRLKALMAAGEALDRQLVEKAESRHAILKDQLLSSRKGRQAARGYRPVAATAGGSRFVDRTG